jgi:hypothetical protein
MAHELGHNLGAHHDYEQSKLLNAQNISCTYADYNLMHASRTELSSGYVISQCTRFGIRFKLFGRVKSNNLLNKFKCLKWDNCPRLYKNEKKEIKYLNNALKMYQNPVGVFSLSEQCEMTLLRSSNSHHSFYSCDTNINCSYLYCSADGRKCEPKDPVFDGTYCDKDSICLEGKCVNVNEAFIHSNTKLDESNNVKSPKFQTAIDNLRTHCPQRLTRQNSITHMICDEILLRANNQTICDAKMRSLCCEHCLKHKLLNLYKFDDEKKLINYESLYQNPCFNDGQCVNARKKNRLSNYLSNFNCICPKGFSGMALI